MPDDDRYSLTELADLAGVTPRTVRYYLAQGLLPAVGQTGPGSKYGADHLDRLRLIKRLQAEHLPLAEIRHRLEGLDPETIRDLAGGPEPAPPPGSALDYLRTVLGTKTTVRPPTQPMAAPPAAEGVPLYSRLSMASPAQDAPAIALALPRRPSRRPPGRRHHHRRHRSNARNGNGSCSLPTSSSTFAAPCHAARTSRSIAS